MPKEEYRRRPRPSTNHLLIIVALAIAAGRIVMVTSKEGDTAFLSANDRSRWCTVASLVEHGTYAIDAQINLTDGSNTRHRPWNTIDKVRHLGKDGEQRYYSSKPPLFPTMVAGVYKVVQLATGMTMTEQPVYVTRILLALVNLPLLALFCFATIKSIERVCLSERIRQFASLCTCFGTMMLPFAISLNNHLPAAAATAAVMWIYLYAAEKLDEDSDSANMISAWVWLAAGIAAAMAAANELPALSMMVFWFILLTMLDRASVLPYLAGVAIVVVGFFGTNWIAHSSLRPPYAHRGNGALIAELKSSSEKPDLDIEKEVRKILNEDGQLAIVDSDESRRWVVQAGHQRFALLREEGGWRLADWDDWYEYPGTYWKDGERRGVDEGESSRLTYLLQMTLGHHGIFSLTPIWILVPLGLIRGLGFGPPDYRRLALAILIASVVCLLFYLSRPLIDRNYGGVSVCFRWMLWFAPLWLLVIAPVMERFAETRWRRIALQIMLALSVFSMSTALQSPWQSPWLYQFWQFLGWISA